MVSDIRSEESGQMKKNVTSLQYEYVSIYKIGMGRISGVVYYAS